MPLSSENMRPIINYALAFARALPQESKSENKEGTKQRQILMQLAGIENAPFPIIKGFAGVVNLDPVTARALDTMIATISKGMGRHGTAGIL